MTLCTQCRRHPARINQRNCHQCHAKANRIYRHKLKRERIAMAWIIHRAVQETGRAA